MIELGRSRRDSALLCSDMHLGDHDPAGAALFLGQLAAHVGKATHLFLLGDLFEAWVGDDQPDAAAGALIEELARLSAAGVQVLVMRGNRDFLLDMPFPADASQEATSQAVVTSFQVRTGATMLEDPCTIRVFGEPVLLAHGDALCTDDQDYQRARALARSSAWQAAFLRRALPDRLVIARQLRDQSRRAQATRLMSDVDPGDVNAAAVDAALRTAGARTLIHGHTHRPAHHRWLLDGASACRWVLPDWHAGVQAGGGVRRGGFLRIDSAGWKTIALDRPDGRGSPEHA